MIQRRETSSSFEKKKYIPTVGKKIMHVNVYMFYSCTGGGSTSRCFIQF